MKARMFYYSSDGGSLDMRISKPHHLVKAFKTIFLMEQSKIIKVKEEEKGLIKAKKLIYEKAAELIEER